MAKVNKSANQQKKLQKYLICLVHLKQKLNNKNVNLLLSGVSICFAGIFTITTKLQAH